MFSVDSVIADLALESQVQADINTQVDFDQLSLTQSHQATGADTVFNDFGFDGTGQTIAVIDSGIAYDHFALGGGFGAGARVVGGYDFAEGDDDPYDDGPAGFHGTHVSGIIASDDPNNLGVASGVDLVGLRVFDDAGAGRLEWVEQALQWVIENKNAFENPITTVNLSLGIEFNSNTVPGFATLEDEFAQLEANNIFISVAAGNSFQNFNQAGLAYPAVSEHVVPVASHGADGQISDFSQRNDRVLVAPGESIRSTVPGHLFGQQTSNQFLSASGTSQAAPYVAGASAVLREAFQFAGIENINQDLLYEHFRDTAGQIFDAATNGFYSRLDLGAAIEAVIQDAHADSAANATDLGRFGDTTEFQGTIGKFSDVDAFRYTADQSGQVTLQISESHDLQSSVRVNGQVLEPVLTAQGRTVTFDVVAGESYDLTLSTDAGIGHYQVDVQFSASLDAIDIGQIVSQTLNNQLVQGDVFYAIQASQDGILTTNIPTQSDLNVRVFDSSLNLVSQGTASNGILRTDTWVNAGEQYFIQVIGNSDQFDLQLTNQVSLASGFLGINGTQTNDNISIQHTDTGQIRVTVSGTNYQFSAAQVQHVHVNDGGGTDRLDLDLEGTSDRVFLIADRAQVTNDQFTLSTDSFDSINVQGNASDTIIFLDSAGNDHFQASAGQSSLTGDGFRSSASGFGNVQAFSRSGNDSAQIDGSIADDRFVVNSQAVRHHAANSTILANGFGEVSIHGRGGSDSLVTHASEAADSIELQGRRTTARLDQTQFNAISIEQSIIVSSDVNDTVTLLGTVGDDRLFSSEESSILSGNRYQNVVLDATNVTIDVSHEGGNDSARILDTSGNDIVTGDTSQIRVQGNGTDRSATGFSFVTVVAENGGMDHATFVGSHMSENLVTTADAAWIIGNQFRVGLRGFEQLSIDGGGGHDTASLTGDDGQTDFILGRDATTIFSQNYQTTISGFESQNLDGGHGRNTVTIQRLGNDDRVTAEGAALQAFLGESEIRAENFFWLQTENDPNESANLEIGAIDFWHSFHGADEV